ncbi:MAG: carboxymuconolactone decarboxylase family protein [Deltaproteobacteria bacterium]|nr:carboxymuconolactone decarboxylase family protein [Deltaproteobacteria bacterium]
MDIASDIQPGDDPVEVSTKLLGSTRTRLLRELFDYFDIPHDYINHFFGSLYTRDTLTQKERELCAVAALCVLNRKAELKGHIIAAIRSGASKAEVAEVLLQMSTYGGMPVCVEGLAIARQVFEKAEKM